MLAQRLSSRRALGALLFGFAALSIGRADEPLARSVPADTGFFVEMRGAADLLTSLTEPQIWTALAEFAGQPARPEDAQEWRRQIRQTIKMDPNDAIRELFSQRVAFIGDAPGRSQDAVVLCRPPAGVPLKDLIARFKAQRLPEPQRPATYSLHNNIGVAEFDGLLLFGDMLPENGLFRRILRFAADGKAPRLADDPIYKQLESRIAQSPDGVMFARLRSAKRAAAPVSQPASNQAQRTLDSVLPAFPGVPGDAAALMVGVHREGRVLRLSAAVDVAAKGKMPESAPAKRGGLLAGLPDRVLAAWEIQIDYPALRQTIQELPPRHVLRIAGVARDGQAMERLTESLAGDTCIVIGESSSDGGAAPVLPVVAWLTRTRDGDSAEEAWHELIDAAVAAYNVLSLNVPNVTPLPRAEDREFAGAPGAMLDLTAALPARIKAGLGKLEICWALHDDVLIVTTSEKWLLDAIAGRSGGRGTLSESLKPAQRAADVSGDAEIVVQTARLSAVCEQWLEYLRSAAPQVMEESWWRKNQPGGATQRLGIDVTNDPKRMSVRSVTPGDPADGWLAIGDRLVGANSRRFATTQPWVEMRTAFAERPHGAYFDVMIERGGAARSTRIPIPFFNGVQAMQRMIAIGKIVDRVTYFSSPPSQAGALGVLTIELRPAAAGPPATSPTQR